MNRYKRMSYYRYKGRIRATIIALFIAILSFEAGIYVNEYNNGTCIYEVIQ